MDDNTDNTAPTISFWGALQYWFKLGFISFGGPAAQIAMMHSELVEKRRWISEQRFLHALNYCMLLPGPEATQLAIYIGWLLHKTLGGILAGVLFVLPSLLLLIGLSWAYLSFDNTLIVAGFLYGIKPAIVVIVLAAAWRIGKRSLTTPTLIAIAIAAFCAITLLHLAFPWIIATAALFGIIVGHFNPAAFVTSPGHASKRANYGAAVIDDDTPSPKHAAFSWIKLVRILLLGVLIAVVSCCALGFIFGWHATHTQMAVFFSKAALLTFGGAYAVLPYVYQNAVNQFHWLNSGQMMDGLALGETTPGPLIMIVTYVGFIGGWNQAAGGSHFISALTASCVATFFTFLPSFIFILAGAPLVESTRKNVRLAMPLAAISAAVVGVIVSLAVFFAGHALIGAELHADLVAISLTLLAGVAVFRFQLNTIALIVGMGILGMLLRLIG